MLWFLQAGGVDGPNILFIGLITLVLAVGLGYWVYTDAKGRGTDNAELWALAVAILTLLTLVGGLLGFAFYIWRR